MQKRFWNFKDDDSTLDLSNTFQGILPAGIYRGFNFVPGSGLNIILSMSPDGVRRVSTDLVESAPTGVIITRQGVIITENENIILPVLTNPGGTGRTDIIICSHQYEPGLVGGLEATYSVVTGIGGTVVPAVPNPLTDIKIAELYLPAGTTSLAGPGITYKKVGVPHFGNVSDDYNQNNDYATQNFVTNGQNRKQAIESLDAGLKQAVVQQGIVKQDSVYPTVKVTLEPIPSVPGRKEYIVTQGTVDLGENPDLNLIYPSGMYKGHNFAGSNGFTGAVPGIEVGSIADLSFGLTVNTYESTESGEPRTVSHQILQLAYQNISEQMITLTRMMSKNNVTNVLTLGKWFSTFPENNGGPRIFNIPEAGVTVVGSNTAPRNILLPQFVSAKIQITKLGSCRYLIDMYFVMDLGGAVGTEDVDRFSITLPMDMDLGDNNEFRSVGYSTLGTGAPQGALENYKDGRPFIIYAVGRYLYGMHAGAIKFNTYPNSIFTGQVTVATIKDIF